VNHALQGLKFTKDADDFSLSMFGERLSYCFILGIVFYVVSSNIKLVISLKVPQQIAIGLRVFHLVKTC